MNYSFRYVLAALLCLLTLPAIAGVKLTAEQRENLGIEVQPLESVQLAETFKANAQVLDPAPLIGQMGDLRAAQSQAMSSRNELERLERLYKAESNVSLRASEAGRAQASADAAKLASMRAQLFTSVGRGLANLNETDREHLVNDLIEGRVALARAETLRSIPGSLAFHSARLHSLGSDATWDAEVLGLAAQSSGQAVGSAYLLRVNTNLQPGTLLAAELRDTTHTLRGIKVPRSAIIRWQGSDWIYIEAEPNVYERQLLVPSEWLEDGCLVKEGLKAGQKVARVGAAFLLAAEIARPAED